jgi:hypothetical protein
MERQADKRVKLCLISGKIIESEYCNFLSVQWNFCMCLTNDDSVNKLMSKAFYFNSNMCIFSFNWLVLYHVIMIDGDEINK